MSALALSGIRKRYGALETLKGIDLSLDSGEFLVLLGPSGCGKSTLLNIIAGLIEPSAGDIRIAGRSVIGVHPKDRDIAMVFQSYALYPNLTVERNIGFALEMRGVPVGERAAAVRRVAAMLRIDHLLDRRPAALSGGQRQRVAIGRALVRNPAIFLFDEPLSNLDAKLRMETRTELKRLHQALAATVVYVTHDQIEAMTLATRIAVMRDGEIEQLGTPEEIYQRPASLYVAGFVGSPPMNMLSGTATQPGVDLDGGMAFDLPPGRRLAPGTKVVVGIRPENLAIADGSPTGLEGTVDVVELTGPEKLVSVGVGGQTIVASLPASARIAVGERRRFVADAEALHLFDPDTGRAVPYSRVALQG